MGDRLGAGPEEVTNLLLRALPWLALILVAWFGGCEYQKGREIQNRIDALELRNAYLEDRVGIVDTQYVTDTLRLGGWKTRYDSLRLDLTLHDPVKINPLILAADSAIAACDKVIATCEQRVAQRDTLLAGKDSIIALQKKRGGTDWKTILGALMVGAAAGRLIPR